MWAVFYHGVRVSEFYQDHSLAVKSKEWKEYQNKVTAKLVKVN